ncbi:DUF3307 domain-containing protein [Psychroflexus montanilacus]|uniref:DUF3307 domain-containing protein n=1 Tax=Psychroflexus montanilacus TaxID=2873598 RepID=UPI001CD02C9D|nr:DUF3307 domain-containing protein [Psychroflexus montanilacus]MBZ9650745.1 DUF3307 domain-containing protein [Psychroflexus montanilacus]
MIAVLLKLLLAHFIGDFVLQPYKWVQSKETEGLKSKYFWFHIGIHFILMLVFIGFQQNLIPIVIGIGLSHLVIDYFKIKLNHKFSSIRLFFLDQGLHLLVILISLGFYFDVDWSALVEIQDSWLVLLLALVLITYVSGVIMKVLLSKWNLENFEGEALHKAGWYIGVLERLFILGFVVTDYWAGIGFLIAAKSIFRFSDLSRSKDRKLTEYVLIGTLLSYGLALVIAIVSYRLWIFLS